MHPPGPPYPPGAPPAAGRPWLAALLLAGGVLSLLAGWLALHLSGLLPGARVAPARPTTTIRLATPAPATPRAVPAPGAALPGELAARYLASWAAGDYDAMYDLLAPAARQRIGRDAFRERYTAIGEEAMIVRLEAALAAEADPRSASQPFVLTVETARTGVFRERNALPFVLTGGQWGIDWQPSLIFAGLRPGDRVRLLPDTPTRGRILDRNGQILAHQIEMATIGIVPAELVDADREIEQLSAALGLAAAAVRQQAAAGRPDWFVPLARRPWRSPPPALRALAELPGVEVRVNLERTYPLGAVAAHVVGYVGPVRPEADGRLRERGYRAGEWIGVAGVEASAEALLAGERGGRLMIVAPDGTTRRVLAERPARPGSDVYLTLDLALQRAAEAALGDRAGALVGLDPATGAIRALVSRPAFDPNTFVQGAPAAIQALVDDEAGRPLLNRATAAAYPPGELFTTVTLAAALEGLRLTGDAPIDCPATFRLPGRPEVWRDRQPDGRGRLTLRQAFVQSCPTAFYALAQRLDARDRRALPEMARRFGLGVATGLTELPETAGALPAPGGAGQWTAADALNLAVGQGGLEATPLQLVRAYAAIANGGRLWTPRLIERVRAPDGPAEAVAAPAGPPLVVAPATLAVLRAALTERSIAPGGLPQGANRGYHAYEASAGLSGAAATGIGGSSHAWSVAYTPAAGAQLALVVLIERGGDGERMAAPLVQQVLERGLRPGLSANLAPINRPVSRNA